MKNKIIQVRGLLERNKIFFEILTATVITFTSIYISLQANSISKIQTKIMELENTPKIEIRNTQLYSDSIITKWDVFNHNSKISNFEIEKQISYMNVVKRKNYKELNIPVMNYLNIGNKLSGQNEGLIYEFDNMYSVNNEHLIHQKIEDYGFTQIKSFIQISYDDVLEEKDIKYYQITPQIKEISKITWDSISKDWSTKGDNLILYLENDIDNNIKKIKNYK
nr:hypothetical protein [uncultured Flavobacterium sp.]